MSIDCPLLFARGDVLVKSIRDCHTLFLSQNLMFIVCVPRNQVYTYTVQKIDTE
jgi:hypothetical protein